MCFIELDANPHIKLKQRFKDRKLASSSNHDNVAQNASVSVAVSGTESVATTLVSTPSSFDAGSACSGSSDSGCSSF